MVDYLDDHTDGAQKKDSLDTGPSPIHLMDSTAPFNTITERHMR